MSPKPSRGRRQYPIRPKTVSAKRATKFLQIANQDKRRHLPLTRADCIDAPRPCPFVSCRYHLYLDIVETGNIKLVFPDLEPGDLVHSCALDVAEAGGATLEEIGALLNMTRERIRQIEIIAMAKVELRTRRF